jgi:hypothetical protein
MKTEDLVRTTTGNRIFVEINHAFNNPNDGLLKSMCLPGENFQGHCAGKTIKTVNKWINFQKYVGSTEEHFFSTCYSPGLSEAIENLPFKYNARQKRKEQVKKIIANFINYRNKSQSITTDLCENAFRCTGHFFDVFAGEDCILRIPCMLETTHWTMQIISEHGMINSLRDKKTLAKDDWDAIKEYFGYQDMSYQFIEDKIFLANAIELSKSDKNTSEIHRWDMLAAACVGHNIKRMIWSQLLHNKIGNSEISFKSRIADLKK